MGKLQRGYAGAMLLLWLAVVLVGGGGWIANIVKLVHMTEILTGMGVARIVGIFFAPLGAVLGFL